MILDDSKISLKELIISFLNELKAVLKEYLNEQQEALKPRLKKILIITIISSVLSALGISMAGSASLFILIGSLRYLQTQMPTWAAWLVMGATAAITAAILFLALYLIIKKQLSTSKKTVEQK
jgi:ABC-type multidrug transport system permease subunit